MFWACFFIAIFAVVIWFWATARHMVRASQGPEIGPRRGSALLLVDLQRAVWRDRSYDATTRARVEAAIAREVTQAQFEDQPVVALRHEWSGVAPRVIAHVTRNGAAMKGSPEAGLAAPFVDMPDHVLVKRVEDGFETGALDALFDVLGVGAVRIVGCDGVHAVARTAQGALNRGYAVTLVGDAIATGQPDAFTPVAAALVSQGAQLRR